MAERAGADSITAHLREDRRHIQDRDIFLLKSMIQTRLNLEMAVTDEMLAIATNVQPQACCLVPEKRAELTTEGGLDIVGSAARIKSACQQLAEANTEVSLFIDPDQLQIDAAVEAGAPVVELHTGTYADAKTSKEKNEELQRIKNAAVYAHGQGLQVNAGHGLTYHNVEAIAKIPEVVELNIGHSIIARAVFGGLPEAVREMKALMRCSRV